MPCTHPRFRTLPKDLFTKLGSFRELERRISSLCDNTVMRGDAFEVFIEGYLRHNHLLYQLEDLWHVGRIPLQVRKDLNLPPDITGIDGIYRTKGGILVPYQVKFRSDRPRLSWEETSSFFGITGKAETRILFSNSDHFSAKVESRRPLTILRGTDFDAITPFDMQSISGLILGIAVRPERKRQLRPDQQKAVSQAREALKVNDRATIVMACGTGKTLVGLRVAESLNPATVLVLVPSLALVAQVLEDTATDTVWGDRFEYLCVCSDPAVASAVDQWSLRPTEVPFPVQTSPATVRKFLGRPAGEKVRVVFSTYHSAPVVAQGMPKGVSFDFGLFDEAHKTTAHTFALSNERLRIRKRLFLTATPKRVNIRKRDRAGDFEIASMDDEATYGKRAYTLSFADAVKLGVICDYRVVISTVEPREVSDFALAHGLTKLQGDLNATRWVATQVALQKAVKATGAKRIITFHSRVEQARAFASESPKGIQQFLQGFTVGHVNGSQPVADRKSILQGFREDKKMLVTNARCLTEGIDLPAVDMVAFNSPRKSRIDIIQAIGRAMRKPKGGNKKLGYIVIPVQLSPTDAKDVENACRGTDWEDVVDVLSAMRDQDGRLEQLLRDEQIARGRSDHFNPRLLKDRVLTLGSPRISVATLQKHITAVVLERIGVPWDLRFGQLQAFKRKHGHCNVPRIYRQNTELGHWAGTQRNLKQAGKLSADRCQKLVAEGFSWHPFDDIWEEMFAGLKRFKEMHGHCDIPGRYAGYPKLGGWLTTQRSFKREGRLSQERIRQLEDLGVSWNPFHDTWEEMFAELKRFKEKHGHCSVPASDRAMKTLWRWLVTQRSARQRGKITPQRIAHLDEVGFSWSRIDETWDKNFAELERFKAKHGHCNVGERNRGLSAWLSSQRGAKKANRLSDERVKKLEVLGVQWEPLNESWYQHYKKLVSFKQRHGHLRVASNTKQNAIVARWMRKQRGFRRRGSLSKDRIRLLEQLGFTWNPLDEAWEEIFAQLKQFKAKHGHCKVSSDSKGNQQLHAWVVTQRAFRKAKRLSKHRIDRLTKLGFMWEGRLSEDKFWLKRIEELKRFKRKHGHCNVSTQLPCDKSLGLWLVKCRKAKKSGQLSSIRVTGLERIGVVWDIANEAWMLRYNEIRAFRRKHGHCRVPETLAKLRTWVLGQRVRKKKGVLSDDKVAKLDALNFAWSPFDEMWENRLEELKRFKKQHGHCNVPPSYTHSPALGRWIVTQRIFRRKGLLSKERVNNLTKLRFSWNPSNS